MIEKIILIIEGIILLITNYISSNIGHFLVFFFMAIESSFIPFPSEIIMIPAGTLSSLGHLNIYLVILLGTLGSVVGALINYYIGYYFGRCFLLKRKKLFFIKSSHLEKTEHFFKKYGKSATFFARLIPVVRQYISLPAGFSKMNLKDFLFFTFLGSFIWVSFLAIIGFRLGDELSKSVINYFNIIILLLVCLFVIVITFYYFYKKIK